MQCLVFILINRVICFHNYNELEAHPRSNLILLTWFKTGNEHSFVLQNLAQKDNFFLNVAKSNWSSSTNFRNSSVKH